VAVGEKQGVYSRDEVRNNENDRSVIHKDKDEGGWERVTKNEERVLW